MRKLLVLVVVISLLAAPNLSYSETPQTQLASTQETIFALIREIINLLLKQIQFLQVRLQAPTATEKPQETIMPPAQAVVYLSCRYEEKNIRAGSETTQEATTRGTGVIVSKEGYIVTARHIVDPGWTVLSYPDDKNIDFYTNLKNNFALSNCAVALPARDTLLTTQEIQSNAQIPAGPLIYKAEVFHLPSSKNLSEDEYKELDFAILKISELLNCPNSACALPAEFQSVKARLAPEDYKKSNQVATFGYLDSKKPELRGITGTLKKYFGGDLFFKNKPLNFEWAAQFNVYPGSSGAPIFARGYLIGIELGIAEDSVANYGLAIGAIDQIIKEAGLGNVLTTE